MPDATSPASSPIDGATPTWSIRPGFFFGKDGKPAPKDVLSKRFNRLSFGHSELTGVQMWETAAGEGERAAQQILEVILMPRVAAQRLAERVWR